MSAILPLPGTERIRSLKDVDAIFQAFDAYPWKKDAMFMSGLIAMLGDPVDFEPDSSPEDMATHARIFYYAQRVGVVINYAKYKSWLGDYPGHRAPTFLPEITAAFASIASPARKRGVSPSSAASADRARSSDGDRELSELSEQLGRLDTESSISSRGKTSKDKSPERGEGTRTPSERLGGKGSSIGDVPTWQAAAPKLDLYVERGRVGPADGQGPPSQEPSYPLRFAEMIRMLQEGVPIPGIRTIPDIIARDPASKPFGARVAPRKPWENLAVPATKEDNTAPPDKIELEFPSVAGHQDQP